MNARGHTVAFLKKWPLQILCNKSRLVDAIHLETTAKACERAADGTFFCRLPTLELASLVTNSILFGCSFIIKDPCKKVCFEMF